MINTNQAKLAFKALSGVACIYKPASLTIQRVRGTVLGNICRDLNDMESDPPDQLIRINGPTNEPMSIEIETNLACHPHVTGPKYLFTDINCNYGPELGRHTSGLCLLGFHEGARILTRLYHSNLTRAFKIHGVLGKSTDTYFKDGKVTERATFKHVDRSKMDNVISYIQSVHQKKMFDILGVDIQSQAAYELAIKGPVRPANDKLPLLYGIKCVNFEPPNFIIEVQCVNEYEKYFFVLIHDIGIQLRSAAHCTAIQCIRYGKFTLDDALLRKHWDLQNFLNSVSSNRKLLKKENDVLFTAVAELQ